MKAHELVNPHPGVEVALFGDVAYQPAQGDGLLLTVRPSTLTLPESGRSKPNMMRMAVVLPAPLGRQNRKQNPGALQN